LNQKKWNIKRKSAIVDGRNVWLLRVGLVIVMMFFVFWTDNEIQPDIPEKSGLWAENWVKSNELNKPVEPLYAYDNNVNADKRMLSEVSNSRKDIKKNNSTSPISKSTNKISVAYSSHNVISELEKEVALGYLASNSVQLNIVDQSQEVFLIKENSFSEFSGAEDDLVITSYESQLQKDYQVSQKQITTANPSEMPSNWMVRGAVGPQMYNGVVNQPNGPTYASLSGQSDIRTTTVGVSNASPNNSFTASVNLGINVAKNLELLSGVNFTQLDGKQTAYYDSEVRQYQTILTSEVATSADGTQSISTKEEKVMYSNYYEDTLQANYRISSFEIPLVLKYNFGKRRLNYFVSSGISASIGSSYSSVYKSTEIGTGDMNENKSGVNAINFLMGAGIQYKASKNIRLQLAPGFKYGYGINSNSVFQTPVTSLGLFTGLSYYFD
jgi:hypothetical protein